MSASSSSPATAACCFCQHKLDSDDGCQSLYEKARESSLAGIMSGETIAVAYQQVWDRSSCCCHLIRRQAGQKLALLLLQSGRAEEAGRILHELGYTFRIAESIFNNNKAVAKQNYYDDDDRAYCHVYDGFLQDDELRLLQECFMDKNGSYWTSHHYSVEPPSPYFSYLLPLNSNKASPFGTIGSIVHRLFALSKVNFPAVKRATVAEIWAHNRPHTTGHQFHFDSDNEGCTEVIRNPLVSCVLYLSSNKAGGPTVVTTQRLNSQSLANRAWVVAVPSDEDQEGRLVMFDGKLLHGVIPGSGYEPTTHHRVTLMVAFWKSIRARDTVGQAACAQWPVTTTTWAKKLTTPPLSTSDAKSPQAVRPVQVSPVYESVLEGRPWTKSDGFPAYEQIFQGV